MSSDRPQLPCLQHIYISTLPIYSAPDNYQNHFRQVRFVQFDSTAFLFYYKKKKERQRCYINIIRIILPCTLPLQLAIILFFALQHCTFLNLSCFLYFFLFLKMHLNIFLENFCVNIIFIRVILYIKKFLLTFLLTFIT